MNAERLIRDAVELRLAAIASHACYTRRPETQKALLKGYRANYKQALNKGTIQTFYSGSQLLGVLFSGPSRLEQTGQRLTKLTLDFRLGSPEALKWTKKALKEARARSPKSEINLMLMAPYRALIPSVSKNDMHVENLILVGDTKVSLASLRKKYGKLEQSDFSINPIRSERQIRDSLSILKREFERNPQFGWFVADPRYINKERKMLRLEAKRRRPNYFVMESGGKTLGYFGVEFNPKNAVWGKVGGYTFCFSEAIQGKGLLKYAYSVLLKRLEELGADTYIGGTSQPSVLKLSRLMKRKPFAYIIRNGPGYFPSSYFSRFE